MNTTWKQTLIAWSGLVLFVSTSPVWGQEQSYTPYSAPKPYSEFPRKPAPSTQTETVAPSIANDESLESVVPAAAGDDLPTLALPKPAADVLPTLELPPAPTDDLPTLNPPSLISDRLPSFDLPDWSAIDAVFSSDAEEAAGVATVVTNFEPFAQPVPTEGVAYTSTSAATARNDCYTNYCCGERAGFRLRQKRRLQESHWGYCDLFHEAPFGASVEAAMSAQIARGDAAQMVVYHADFQPDTANLKPSAIVRLSRIGRLASRNTFPIIVQRTGNDDLDAARQAAVLQMISELGFSFPQERVITDTPPSKGLSPADISTILRRRPLGGGSTGQSSQNTQPQGSSSQQGTSLQGVPPQGFSP